MLVLQISKRTLNLSRNNIIIASCFHDKLFFILHSYHHISYGDYIEDIWIERLK